MAIQDAFPGASATVDTVKLRKDLAGLIVRDVNGDARPGIFPRHPNSLITARADMKVDVGAFEGVSVRGGGPLFIANDGVAVVSLDPAPVANSRYDIIYFKQNESVSPFTDANNLPVLDKVTGPAAASPSLPAARALLPAGAVELGHVLIPSGKTATNQVGVVVTATHQFTGTSGGHVAFRTHPELLLWTTAPEGQHASVLIDSVELRNADFVRRGGVWIPTTPISGEVGVPVTSSNAGNAPITFPPGLFVLPPRVFVSMTQAVSPSQKLIARAFEVTKDGGKVGVYTGDSSTLTILAVNNVIAWLAVPR